MHKTATTFLRTATLPVLALLLACHGHAALAVDFPGPSPGAARAKIDGGRLLVENDVLACTWTVSDGRLRPERLVDKLSAIALDLAGSECFQVLLGNSPLPGVRTVKASELTVVGAPRLVEIQPSAGPRAAEQFAGRTIVVDLASPDGNFKAQWQATLRDGSNYVRQRVQLTAAGEPIELVELLLWDVPAPDARVVGSVDGSPAVSANAFFACEHPMAWSRVANSPGTPAAPPRLRCGYTFSTTLRPGESAGQNWVAGVVPAGQLRRGFLYYLERERAHPYRPFLHYNNGSEIGCRYWQEKLHGKPGDAERFRQGQQHVWLGNIHAFGRELVAVRGVHMDSFVHDFEWDDQTTPWQFHSGYPHGFAPARQAAAEHGARVGVWLSPWGGYPGRASRIESGRRLGFETNDKGLSLAGPRYDARVRAACTGMIRNYGVNYFKFDGFGAGNNQPGAGPYPSDVEALLRLIVELRGLEPEVFVNPSTGSWPSPFWLLWADSIWRQGSDTSLAGKGSQRQKWITYRDGEIYRGILARAPLYPLNSLMIHGIFINRLPLFGNPYDPAAQRPDYEPGDVVDEIRSFFGTGTDLQELYVAPDLMTSQTWDALAEAAKWSRANADVLADTHWIGGDPAQGEVYGWASWSHRKAILVLRNPDDRPAKITLDLAKVFELPAAAPRDYELKSPWKQDAAKPPIAASAGEPHQFELGAFEVVTLEALPAARRD